MKPVKIALCLALLIALSNSGYSEEWKPKTLSDPGEHSSLDVQSAPWLTMEFLTNRGTLGKRTCRVVPENSGNSVPKPCVKSSTKVVYNGNRVYTEVECRTYSMMCTRQGNNCVPVYSSIHGLGKRVTDCECQA